MSEMKFSPLYKEDKGSIPGERKEEEQPDEARGFFSRHRIRIGIFMLLFGFLLFSLQSLSLSERARPYSALALLRVNETGEPVKENGEKKPEGDAGRQDSEAHYKGEPSEEFLDRFEALAAGLEIPEGLAALPVRLLQREARYLVEPGREPEKGGAAAVPAYLVLETSEQDARSLLRPLVAEGVGLSGKFFLGPFPHRDGDGRRELVLPGRRGAITMVLPGEASALRGLIVAPVPEIRPNALLIVPRGTPSLGDFRKGLNALYRTLYENLEKLEKEHKLRPLLSPSDFRHSLPVFALAAGGEVLFLAGGFIIFFHLFAGVASKEVSEGRSLLLRMLVDSCRLVVSQGQLYAMVVAFVLGFWLWGMVTAHLDPGKQLGIIQWLRSQFAGGGWPLGYAGWAYASGNIFLATAITFAINFLQGTVLILSLPSLIPIASAFIINALRGQMLGMALSPTYLGLGQGQTLHLLTILLELQGYLLAAFVSVLLPLALLKPERFGMQNRKAAYKHFALWQFRILPLIAIILLVSALYEAVELIILANLS